MAGSIKTNSVQLGDSATATQNFVWQTNVDGTAKLARGNVGATTQDILTVDASGRVAMPQNVVAFSAYSSSAQVLVIGPLVKVIFQSLESGYPNVGFSVGATVGDALSRFQPNVAGFYCIDGSVQIATTATSIVVAVAKNGAEYKRGANNNSTQNSAALSCLVYLNGSTDYVELHCAVAASQSTLVASNLTYFQGILITKA